MRGRRVASSRGRRRKPLGQLRALVVELEQLDQRLLKIAASLAPSTVSGILGCVHNDLLRDALDTLRAAAYPSEGEL